jgi:hypothetical protein
MLSKETSKDAVLQGIQADDGLEPTAFCMANAGGRSRRFAPVRRNLLFASLRRARVHGNERERTPRAAIAAIVSIGTMSSADGTALGLTPSG